MPMLDEAEFTEIEALYVGGIRSIKQERQHSGLQLHRITIGEQFQPMLDAFERLTGFRESNANAILHHRLALYGAPCEACGKPLRTPRASRCMDCGAAKSTDPSDV